MAWCSLSAARPLEELPLLREAGAHTGATQPHCIGGRLGARVAAAAKRTHGRKNSPRTGIPPGLGGCGGGVGGVEEEELVLGDAVEGLGDGAQGLDHAGQRDLGEVGHQEHRVGFGVGLGEGAVEEEKEEEEEENKSFYFILFYFFNFFFFF